MLAVYETIDLGLVSTLRQISVSPNNPPLLDLLEGNHPAFLTDPIHDDTIYVYHAFGVHTLQLGPVLQSLAIALRTEDDSSGTSLDATLQQSAGTSVRPILTTFSVERKFVAFIDPLTYGRSVDDYALTDALILWLQSLFQTTSI
jgi:nucleoporin NUP82